MPKVYSLKEAAQNEQTFLELNNLYAIALKEIDSLTRQRDLAVEA